MKKPPKKADSPAKPLTIDDVDHARRCLLTDESGRDEIDCAIDPLLLQRPAQRRSTKETSRVLSILDELDVKGWEG